MIPYTPILLVGGLGSRLWPLSRRERPKQFQAALETVSMLQASALVLNGAGFRPPVLVTATHHGELALEQLREVGISPLAVLLEPEPRGTAAALCAAAAYLADAQPDAVAVAMNADNRIADAAGLAAALERARPAAEAGDMVLIGARPTEPSDAYGYLQLSGEGDVRPIARFHEKPDRAAAAAYLAAGDHAWNAGIYAFRPGAFLALAEQHAPQVLDAVRIGLAEAAGAAPLVRLGPGFRAAPSVAVDRAIFEKADGLKGVVADVGWSDVGTWGSLWQAGDKDAADNVVRGPATLVDVAGSVVFSDGPVVLASGVEDLIVVAAGGRVLVARRDDPDGLRRALEALPDAAR